MKEFVGIATAEQTEKDLQAIKFLAKSSRLIIVEVSKMAAILWPVYDLVIRSQAG